MLIPRLARRYPASTIMQKTVALFLSVALCGFGSGGLHAHHGGALYDPARTVTVRGEVTEFKFVFPHTLIYVSVTAPDGQAVTWSGELTTPSRLARGLARSNRRRRRLLPVCYRNGLGNDHPRGKKISAAVTPSGRRRPAARDRR